MDTLTANKGAVRPLAIVGALVVVAAAALVGRWSAPGHDSMAMDAAPAERKPLYWVAPMDPDYRRDGPGKSPMGMDLVPVYADGAADDAPGTVRVDPAVRHNLGVRTAVAERGTLDLAVQTIAEVTADATRVQHLHSRLDGWVEALAVAGPGDPVAAGQSVVSIYAPELVNAQEELLLTPGGEHPLRRAARRRLAALGMTPGQVAELERTGQAQRAVPLVAPAAGEVLELPVVVGARVAPGDQVASVVDLSTVWLQVAVPERDAGRLAKGLPVQFVPDSAPWQGYNGTVERLAPMLDASTRTLAVRVVLDNPGGALRPGMVGAVRIATLPIGPVVHVPRDAVLRGAPADRVVVETAPGRFVSRAVDLGRELGDRVVVLDGLRAGETVVVAGQFLIDSASSRDADLGRMDHGAHP